LARACLAGNSASIGAPALFIAERTLAMKRLNLLPILLLLASASQIAAQDVRYNFDKQAAFATFKTYKWVTLKDAAKLNDLVDKQIKDTVDAELAKKGLTKSDADTADLYVGYQAAVTSEKQYTSYDTGWGYGPGWGAGWYGYGGGYGGGMTTGTTSTIYVGQLALDMYQASAKRLVWRGMASKTLDQKAKPEKQQKNLTKAVAKMLKNYPPKKED
jgi:uncharacterized protein DUF4136